MRRLYILGRVDLLDADGTEMRSVLAQPRRLALLAYLAVTSPKSACRRDRLLGLFWSELPQERARKMLNKAVHFLRQTLGEGAIVSRTAEDLTLDARRVWCDAAACTDAMHDERISEALELYRGDLLPSFYIEDAVEFEAWLDSERAGLRRLAARAAHSLAQRCETEGQFTTAIELARRAVELADEDERAVRELLGLLDRLGDRAGALYAYDKFARRMAAEFGAEPAAETQALIGRVRARSEPAPGALRVEAPSVLIRQYTPTSKTPRIFARKWTLVGLGTLAVAVTVAAGFILGGRSGAAVSLDPNVITVLPFRVTGADRSLDYLQEGMVDLLAAKLTGEGGPRAVDPRSALAAWRRAGSGDRDRPRDAAVGVARGLGSGNLLFGEIVGTGQQLVISASLIPVAGGQPKPTSVQGPADSLLPLVDQLAARILTLGAGEGRRLDAATSTSLPALRAYLEGRAAYRRGRYADALQSFNRALDQDSTFALAGLGLLSAAPWSSSDQAVNGQRGVDVAWAHRERLSSRDRTLITAWLGPNYPAGSVHRAFHEAWERAVRVMPDQPEVWYWMGDHLLHVGRTVDVSDWRERAAAAFRHALSLDSTFSAPLHHLLDLTAATGDREATRRLGALALAVDPADYADFLRWRVALGTTDTAALASMRARYDEMSWIDLARILGWMQVDGLDLGEAPRLFQAHRRAIARSDDPALAVWLSWQYLHNAGRPTEATGLLRERAVPEIHPYPSFGLMQTVPHLTAALYMNGDTVLAAEAARRLETALGPPARDGRSRRGQYWNACLLARWYVALGQWERAARVRGRAQVYVTGDQPTQPGPAVLCWLAVDALMAEAQDRVGWRDLVRRLDSLSAMGGCCGLIGPTGPLTPTLDLARLLERAGNVQGALRAVRRRQHHDVTTLSLATHLREEGRLAALAGDTTAAIQAYRHYLALRPDPEPSVAPEVARVRQELERLMRGHR
jgi:DNA-binding SARP family transcriptional activator